ncbi:DUF982 domain-containing protein [Sinorhizobium sp. B11]
MSQEKSDIHLSIWDIPVYVRIGRGMTETIDGPQEALNYLSNRWPAERGPHYERARSACDLAITRFGSLGEAREAFVAAAIEVNILAR